jgi:hypothetical protein
VVELISPKLVDKLGLQRYPVEESLGLKLANDIIAQLNEYVVVQVIVAGIATTIRAYVMGADDTYKILLSKAWIIRVKAKEDYTTNRLSIKGINGYRAEVPVVKAPVPEGHYYVIIKDGDESEMEEDEANDLINRLIRETEAQDQYEYTQSSQGKASRQ